MRHVSDFNILSDLSPFAIATSAEPRLMSTTNSKLNMTILNTMIFSVYMFLLVGYSTHTINFTAAYEHYQSN